VDEARAVLARLERIEALDRSGAAPDVVLSELRELVQEAEMWARRERDPRAEEAARALGEATVVPAR
jgi:predicted nucleic acid-binding protein